MSNGNPVEKSGGWSWVTSALLAGVGAFAHMLGEFFRELAVLLVIFVPLELWKPQQGGVDFPTMVHVGEGTLLFLAVGMSLEFLSIALIRIKRDLEGNNGS